MKYDTVLVFGASGAVGSATAIEAQARGAKVWLAMRDTSKQIASLSEEQEKSGNYTRIQADLFDSKSVENAVRQSGVKAVFTYCPRIPGGMKAVAEAFKAAGVEYVVVLSSSTINGEDVRSIQPKDFIPYFHAQAEIAIHEAGLDMLSIRPGYFATNPVSNDLDRSKSPVEVNVFKAHENNFDPIDPEDIGRVCGSVLVDRPYESPMKSVVLHGPEDMTNHAIWETIKEVTGQPIEVHHLTKEQYVEMMKKKLPAPIAEYFADRLDRGNAVSRASATDNVKKYTGKDATRFADYVARHRSDFAPVNAS